MNEVRLRITTSYNFVKGDGGCDECKLFDYLCVLAVYKSGYLVEMLKVDSLCFCYLFEKLLCHNLVPLIRCRRF